MSLQDVPGSTHSAFPRRQHATYPFHRTFHVRRLLPHYHSLLNKHTIYIYTHTHTRVAFSSSLQSVSVSPPASAAHRNISSFPFFSSHSLHTWLSKQIISIFFMRINTFHPGIHREQQYNNTHSTRSTPHPPPLQRHRHQTPNPNPNPKNPKSQHLWK